MTSGEPLDDVAALRSLDQDAWSDTYDRYVTVSYSFIAHLVRGDRTLAEELHQETWLTAMSAIDQFAPDRGEFRGWLFGIAKKRVAMHYRRTNRRVEYLVDDKQDQAAANGDPLLPEDVIECVERADAVQAALNELGDESRQVLVNKYVDALSVAEIAERIGKSPKAVESMLTRARSRLRGLLRWYFPDSLNSSSIHVARESL
ncbi:MAG: sigma-70 family RNA polymerase sigma factor [Planctomycetaceae bacterium]|nr:sigma-70 family RNA polymerase sigma factor [Planctomycetaceae bacterium]